MSSTRSDLEMGFTIAADGATEYEAEARPVLAGGEWFPSRWHADRRIEDLKRDLSATEDRLAVENLEESKRAELEDDRRWVLAQLERFA